jgi:hypothetical protein
MTALKQANELLDAIDHVQAAWDELAGALARRLESWGDDPSRTQDALDRVQAATRTANAVVDRALERVGA